MATEEMTTHQMFLKIVEDINEVYCEENEEALTIPLEYSTDGFNSAIMFRGAPLITDNDWCWNGETEEEDRYGKSEYECLKEDILFELEHEYLALGSLISLAKKMEKK